MDVDDGACLTESGSDSYLSKGERSRKKTEGSGSFDPEFAPDGFFHFEALAAIIVCQIVH